MQDQAAELVEVVVVRDRLADVAVLLRRAGRVELLELDAVVDDRLQQVERPDRVRHHGLVRAVPRLADVRLRAEVEDVGLVGRRHEVVADQIVDRRLVGEVGEDDAQLPCRWPMLFSAPDDVARTNAITCASRWTSASVRCEPMKPSAPVTRQVRPA